MNRPHGAPGGRAARRALVPVLLCVLGACAPAAGDAGDEGGSTRPFQAVLEEQAAAVRDGDRAAYLATLDPHADRYRAAQRRVYANLRRLPLGEWGYQVAHVSRDGDEAAVEARLRYRLAGYDRVATTDTERLRFVRRDGDWRLAREASGSATQLWEQGTVTVVRGERSLVLGVGRKRSALRALADAADRAVPAVARTWPHGWTRRTVLQAPSSSEAMGRLLRSPASSYEGIAAVTTGETPDGAGEEEAPADRIVVNPQAFAELSEQGRQVVLTHETTHVATRRQTTAATPMWLSEGIADWSGYRTAKLTPRRAAPELARAVDDWDAGRGGAAPLRSLPTDGDFRFDNDPTRLARAYEGGWLACRMIAEEWGADALVALYERAGREDGGESAGVDAALRSVLGVSRERFTDRWRAYVTAQLGPERSPG
ncbi:nuclear transport factor 2 family protein [Streptomyces reniochalinae]|uniref:Nuclear transport factor 2 family protein n=1 Tax=Streptomyces reniochalinae TaxID=2250578 RepID=A0A367EFY7_9ACTN|nr:nuclear transport factor 2 family protein [Streptomyces reniochalinae]RCG16632.1 nuclear transport factor 2 family protein [Streptomyces reniochalinae]